MPWINHLPPVCWSTFGILVWNDSGYVNLTQWWYFFIIFEYILHISTPHIMIFCFVFLYLIFLSQQVLYFLLSSLVLTLYIDVVLSLSILMEWASGSLSDSVITGPNSPMIRRTRPINSTVNHMGCWQEHCKEQCWSSGHGATLPDDSNNEISEKCADHVPWFTHTHTHTHIYIYIYLSTSIKHETINTHSKFILLYNLLNISLSIPAWYKMLHMSSSVTNKTLNIYNNDLVQVYIACIKW